MVNASPTHSLVVPVYLNSANIPSLLAAVKELHHTLEADLEAIFVVDGSPDDSFARLTAGLADSPVHGRVLLHSRNFGAFAAVRTGLAAAHGSRMAVMAADLQEPIELVAQFFAKLAADEADIVVGTRASRDDGTARDMLSRTYWKLARRIVSEELPKGGVDVFACNALVRDALVGLQEQRSSLIGQLYWLGFRRVEVPYERREREEGKSAWTFRKRVNYLLDSFFSFTDLPIRALTLVGGFGFALATVLGVAIVVARVFGWITVPGYAATVLVVLGFSTLNLLCLGLVGNYVYRAYENSKARPLALVAGEVTFPGESTTREPQSDR